MRLATLSIALLVTLGCRPTAGVLVDDGNPDDGVEDPGVDPGDDDPTDPGDDPTDPVDDPVEPEIPRWEGERNYLFESDWGTDLSCEDTLTEDGIEVTDDPTWANAVEACPICDHVFRVEVAEEFLCDGIFDWWEDGIQVESPTFRGLAIGPSGATIVYRIRQNDGGEWYRDEMADGELNGEELEYEYGGDYYGVPYEVEGFAFLPGIKP